MAKCNGNQALTGLLSALVSLMVLGLPTAVAAQDNYATWTYAMNCTLNTSDTAGAAVAGSVTNFPVLIRLNAGNFNFTQAQPNGGDIRFAMSDDTHLPYAIERFDGGVPDSAEIWVKVDQIIGGNSTQFIKMYWGNSSVVDASQPMSVFDTANGYKGVWHFNSSTDTVDQSANQLKARKSSAINSAKPVFNAGYIGSRSVELNAGNWVTLPSNTLVGADSQITVSFWARGDSLNMPKRNNGTTLDLTNTIESWPSTAGVNMELPTNDGVVRWSTGGLPNSYCGSVPYTDSLDVKIRWNYWTLTKHLPSGRMRIYTNGALREENTQPNVMSTAIDSLVLGDCTWDYSFRGRIDEFRIAKIERDGNWIKLEYANQNHNQTLVRMSGALSLLAPTISYTPTTIIDTQNVLAAVLTPTVGGGAATSITISPALPTGLAFNTSTGVITGTPTTIQGATSYTITATNAIGSGTATITLSVVVRKPTISYTPTTIIDTQGVATLPITQTLVGTVDSITVSPLLPKGLLLNRLTGAITGTPTDLQTATPYTITATNAIGSGTATITLSVVIKRPAIAYAPIAVIDTQNVLSTSITPTLGGGTPYTVTISSPLPTNLTIDLATGVISGTPTALQIAKQYIITATNATGSAKDTITISVIPQRPSIAYPATLSATKGTAIADVTPTLGLGQPYTFAIAPTLPLGLTINATTGIITGTPTAFQSAIAHTITATNATDSAKDTITITVTPANQISNPLTINGTYLSPTRIVVRISGYSTLPTSLILPNTFFAESIGVWSQVATYPVPGRVPAPKRNLLTSMKLRGAEPFIDTIDVTALSAPDSIYALVASVYWKPPAGPDTIAPAQPANGTRVLMRDTTPPVNSLTIAGSYFNNALSDSGTLTIGNVGSIDTNRAAMIEIWRGTVPTPDFTNATATIMRPAAAEYRAGVTFLQIIRGLPVVEDSIYCAVRLKGKNGLYSTVVSSSFIAGKPLPGNPLVLVATAVGSNRIALSWNTVTADSFRIWFSTTAIPLEYQISGTAFSAKGASRTRTKDTLYPLVPNTRYYIGMQLLSGGQWSSVTVASSATATTDTISGVTVVANTIRITRLWFDAVGNQVKVKWTVDNTATSLIVGIASAVGIWPVAEPLSGIAVVAGSDSAVVPLSSIPFGKTVYVSLWLQKEGNPWSAPVTASKDSVMIAGFAWQGITYFSNTVDTVLVDNGAFMLRKDGSYTDDFLFVDTILAAAVPVLNGFVAVSGAYEFQDGATAAQPFYVGIKYDADLAAQYGGASQVRLYRDSSDIMVLCDSVIVDSIHGFVSTKVTRLQMPFVALIDTQWPTASLFGVDTAASVVPGLQIVDSVRLADNTGNLQWHVEYGKGGEVLKSGTLFRLRGTSQPLAITVPKQFVNDDQGVRIYLIISDGVHTDTLDLSRRVNKSEALSQTIAPDRWQPVFASSIIDAPSVDVALNRLNAAGSTVWDYNIKRFRIFRWYTPSSDTSRWLEYSADNAGLFSLSPGKVLWIKTAEQQILISGTGTTTSLKGNFNQIVLPPLAWTDLGMPFKFSVKLVDILDASGSQADSLQWHRWAADPVTNKYKTTGMYIRQSSVISERSTVGNVLRSDSGGFAYTVYNPLPVAVTLSIPPTPPILSRGIERLSKVAQSQLWCVTLNATLTSGEKLNPVHCGFVAGKGAPTALMVPRSFSSSRVELVDRSGHDGLGQLVWHGYQNGGCEYNFKISTDEADAVKVQFNLSGLESLPAGFTATLYNSATGLWENAGDMHVATVTIGRSAMGRLFVGDNTYLAKIRHAVESAELKLYRASAINGTLRLYYSLPFAGISAVQFDLFDLTGRRVFSKRVSSSQMRGGNASTDFTTHQKLTGGMYLIQMITFDDQGAASNRLTSRVVVMQ